MIDDIAACIIDDIVRLPIACTIDIQVVLQEAREQGLCGAKLAYRNDVGLHIVLQQANALILALRVVVSLVTIGKSAVIVAIFQQIILHYSDGVLRLSR